MSDDKEDPRLSKAVDRLMDSLNIDVNPKSIIEIDNYTQTVIEITKEKKIESTGTEPRKPAPIRPGRTGGGGKKIR